MSYLAKSKGLLAGEFVRFQTHSASAKCKRVGKGVLLARRAQAPHLRSGVLSHWIGNSLGRC
jgi:hypothetical protein